MNFVRSGKYNINLDQIAYFTYDKAGTEPAKLVIYFANPNLVPIEFTGKDAKDLYTQYKDLFRSVF